MCDASDYAMGAVLGHKADKMFRAIYYSNKTFNEAQENYSTTKKEMLSMAFACESSSYIYWGPMSSSILIMLQSNI